MSEDSGQEKTEQPTEKRLKDARNKGQVVRSKEFNTMVSLFAAAFALHVFGYKIFQNNMNLFKDLFTNQILQGMQTNNLLQIFINAVIKSGMALLPLLAVILIVTAFAPMLIGGVNFTLSTLQPKLERLSPLSGIKRMFSMKSLIELVKSILKLGLVLAAFLLIVKADFANLMRIGQMAVNSSIMAAASIMMHNTYLLILPLILIAAIDIAYQMWDYNNQLKMTKQEIRDEHKDNEGSPEVKQRIKRLQAESSKRRMMDKLPSASVVITNPNHFAVALKYDEDTGKSPVVVAKGVELVSAMIKKVALAHNIPIVEAPPVARSIYYNVDLDREIPQELFIAVAKVLAYVYELKLYRQGKIKKPNLSKDFSIPERLQHD